MLESRYTVGIIAAEQQVKAYQDELQQLSW